MKAGRIAVFAVMGAMMLFAVACGSKNVVRNERDAPVIRKSAPEDESQGRINRRAQR